MNEHQRQKARRKKRAGYEHGGKVGPYGRPLPGRPTPDVRTERPGIIDEDEPPPRTMSDAKSRHGGVGTTVPNAFKGILEPGEMPTPPQFKRKAVGKRSI